MKFSLGTDPEMFLIDKDGKPISSIGLVGGSKAFPRKTLHGFVQEDNVALECNTLPSFTREQWLQNVNNILLDIEDIVKPLNLSISLQATAVFDEDQLTHPLAKLAGCEPDYECYGPSENSPPNLSKTPMRSAGGHLHIAVPSMGRDIQRRWNFAKVMDICAGIPSVIMDTNLERKRLYGKAGCLRPKFKANGDAFNGLEYRSLSNFWLQSKERVGWAWDTVAMAVKREKELISMYDKGMLNVKEIVHCINNNDVPLAHHYVERLNLHVR